LERQQDFGQVKNAFVRLVNLENNREIARYNLSGAEYQGNTGMILAEIHRQENDWQMLAIGKGVRVNNLQGLIKYYND
jgi:stress response protein SCP2